MNDWIEALVVGVKYEVDQRSLATVEKQFGQAASVLSMGASAIVGVGAAVVGLSLRQAAGQNATAKYAKELRTTTEELTALQYATERTGVAESAMTEGLKALGVRLTQGATDPASAASEALREMGLSARDASGGLKSPAAFLPELARGLEGVADEGKRSEFAIALLGESAQRLEPLLAEGGDGIEALTARAERYGIVLSSEAAANSEALSDALLDLKSVGWGLSRQLGDTVIPHITRAAEAMTDWLLASDSFVRASVERGVDALAWSLDKLDTPLGKAVAGAGAAGTAIVGLKYSISALNVGLKGLGVAWGIGFWPLTAIIGTIALGALALDELIVTAQGGDSVLRSFADALGVGDEAVRILQASSQIATDTLVAGWNLATEAVLMTRDQLQDAAAWVSDVAARAGEAHPALQGIADVIQSIADTISGLFQTGVGDFAGWLEGIAGLTGRLRGGELTEADKARLASQGLGSVVVGSESAAFREQYGRGLGAMQAGARRAELDAMGFRDRGGVEGFTAIGQNKVRENLAFYNLLSGTGFAQLAHAQNRTATAGATAVVNMGNLSFNSGGSLDDMARAAADAVYQQIMQQASSVESLT